MEANRQHDVSKSIASRCNSKIAFDRFERPFALPSSPVLRDTLKHLNQKLSVGVSPDLLRGGNGISGDRRREIVPRVVAENQAATITRRLDGDGFHILAQRNSNGVAGLHVQN